LKGYRDEWCEYHVGDSLEVLKTLPAAFVHCCVTSPPYWGLRSYLPSDAPEKADELGGEETPEAYVERLVAVFREVRRVLRDDGTAWLNLGDAYAAGGTGGYTAASTLAGFSNANTKGRQMAAVGSTRRAPSTMKPKDLIGLPWMAAFALRADGWYLRADVIWAKDSCMPESVRDRPTRSHEHVFLLSKRPRYFYDSEAVREKAIHAGRVVKASGNGAKNAGLAGVNETAVGFTKHDTVVGEGRNMRDVWRINPRPYPEAHYAVFPPELVYPCVKAGTSERGVCGECGAPWERVVEATRTFESGSGRSGNAPIGKNGAGLQGGGETGDIRRGPTLKTQTVGWQPTCACGGPDDIAPGDLEVMQTPTGSRAGDDPSRVTGRAGYNRPRGADEGRRPITRYEQRRYALQLRESPYRDEMVGEAGPAFAYYIRTDRSGARPIPPALLESWVGRRWLKRVTPPRIDPPDVVPATVLDPFAGSGTTALAARKLGRRSIGIDLDERNIKLLERRLGNQGVLL
jgi:DNA modification methylase